MDLDVGRLMGRTDRDMVDSVRDGPPVKDRPLWQDCGRHVERRHGRYFRCFYGNHEQGFSKEKIKGAEEMSLGGRLPTTDAV